MSRRTNRRKSWIQGLNSDLLSFGKCLLHSTVNVFSLWICHVSYYLTHLYYGWFVNYGVDYFHQPRFSGNLAHYQCVILPPVSLWCIQDVRRNSMQAEWNFLSGVDVNVVNVLQKMVNDYFTSINENALRLWCPFQTNGWHPFQQT